MYAKERKKILCSKNTMQKVHAEHAMILCIDSSLHKDIFTKSDDNEKIF